MFQAVLKDVVDASEGVASLVMDLDGIALDSYSRPDAKFDIQMIGIELSVVIKGVVQAATMLDAGGTQEVSIVADDLTTLVRMVNENYFVALSLEPGSNVGKARYMLRTRAVELAEELSWMMRAVPRRRIDERRASQRTIEGRKDMLERPMLSRYGRPAQLRRSD